MFNNNFLGCNEQSILETLLDEHDEKIFKVVQNKEKYELQIIYTKIDRKDNKIKLSTYAFNEQPSKYFYPAS